MSVWPAFKEGCTRRVPREFVILSGNIARSIICDKRKNYSNQQKNQRIHLRSTRASKYLLGSGLPGAFCWCCWCCCCPAATQGRLRKCGGRQGGDTGIAISHSPRKPIVSSSRRTLSARNSARMLRCPLALALRGFVLSRGWSGPSRTKVSMVEQTSARKMVT